METQLQLSIRLTNELAAEQAKNKILAERNAELLKALWDKTKEFKILAEQKAVLVKLLTEIQGKKPLHPSSSESTFYIKSEYDREYKKWMKIEKAIK